MDWNDKLMLAEFYRILPLFIVKWLPTSLALRKVDLALKEIGSPPSLNYIADVFFFIIPSKTLFLLVFAADSFLSNMLFGP